jgi:hypothetical protein
MRKLQESMLLSLQRSLVDIKAHQPYALPATKINALLTHIKNRSSYNILNALQGKDYHLPDL